MPVPVVAVEAGRGTRHDFRVASAGVYGDIAAASESDGPFHFCVRLETPEGWRRVQEATIYYGQYSLDDFPAGRLRIELMTPMGTKGEWQVALAEGERRRLDLAVPGAVVEGLALSSLTSKPIFEARAVLQSGTAALATTTDRQGRFIFRGVANATYTLTGTAFGFAEAAWPVVVASGEARGETTLLLPPHARVRCRLKLAADVVRGMPWVCAEDAEGRTWRAPVVDLDGFTDLSLPAGTCRLAVAGGGIASETVTLTLEPGRTRTQTFMCRPAPLEACAKEF